MDVIGIFLRMFIMNVSFVISLVILLEMVFFLFLFMVESGFYCWVFQVKYGNIFVDISYQIFFYYDVCLFFCNDLFFYLW